MRTAAIVACAGLFLFALAGCREGGTAPPPDSATIPPGSASAPAFVRDEPAEAPAPEAATPDKAAAAKPVDATPEATAETPPAETPKAEEKLPDVEIKNVGMHIGGESNSAASKRPIRNAIATKYDDMRRCYAKADQPAETTFGVDMRIDGKGGPPKITNPRNGLRGEGVKACMVAVFESVTFGEQPNKADRMVSYSVRFKKKK